MTDRELAHLFLGVAIDRRLSFARRLAFEQLDVSKANVAQPLQDRFPIVLKAGDDRFGHELFLVVRKAEARLTPAAPAVK
jgi:hypothetical protein